MTIHIEVQARLNIFYSFSGHKACNLVQTNMGENNLFEREPGSYLLNLQAFLFLRILNSKQDFDVQIGLMNSLPNQIILNVKYKNKQEIASPYKKTHIIALKKKPGANWKKQRTYEDHLLQNGFYQCLLQQHYFKNTESDEKNILPDHNFIIVSDIRVVNNEQFIQNQDKKSALLQLSKEDNIHSYKIATVNDANKEKIKKKFENRISNRYNLAKDLINKANAGQKSLDNKNTKILRDNFNALFDQSILCFVKDEANEMKNEAKFSEEFVQNKIPDLFNEKERSDWINFRETFESAWEKINKSKPDCWNTVKDLDNFSVVAHLKTNYQASAIGRVKCFLPPLDTSIDKDVDLELKNLIENLEFVVIDEHVLESEIRTFLKDQTELDDKFIMDCLLDWLKDMKNKKIRIQEIGTAINVITDIFKKDPASNITETKEIINDNILDELLTIERQIKSQEPVYVSVLARTFLERWGKEMKNFFWNYMTNQQSQATNENQQPAPINEESNNESKILKFLRNLNSAVGNINAGIENEKLQGGLNKFKRELKKTFPGSESENIAKKLENILPKLCKISLDNFGELSETIHNTGDTSYENKEIESTIKCLKNMDVINNGEDEKNWNFMFVTLKFLYSYHSKQNSMRRGTSVPTP